MKRLLFISLLLFNLLIYGQTPCGIKGDGRNARMQFNDSLKNRSCVARTIDSVITINSFFQNGDDTHRFSPNQFLCISGYVVAVKWGGSETCNCHSKDKSDLDIHIELALTPNPDKGKIMVVEITRYNKNDGMGYNDIKKLKGQKVKVWGYLFFDEEHKQNAFSTNPNGGDNWRQTCWELHPVCNIILDK